MPKAKSKRAPNKTSFKVGNPFAFKAKAEPDADLPTEQPSGTEITPRQLLALTKFASLGVRPSDMRFVVNMDRDTWQSYCASHPEVADAIAKGEGQMHDRIAATLYRKAVKGDFLSAALLMNGRFGYKPAPGESAGGNPNVQVNVVNIPAASTAPFIEGDVIPHDDDVDIPGVVVVKPPVHHNSNGATPPSEPDPDPEPPEPEPPPRKQTDHERRVTQQFESEVLGVNTFDPKPSDFPSLAAWHRWNRTR